LCTATFLLAVSLNMAILVSKCHISSHKTQYICTLIPQVSVLNDQVEVQGEKIRDLDSSLEEHRMKLSATEELLQQVCGFIILGSNNLPITKVHSV